MAKDTDVDSSGRAEDGGRHRSLIGFLAYVIAISGLLSAMIMMPVTPNEYLPRWIGYIGAPWLGVWAWRRRRLDAVTVSWVITGLLGATWPQTSSGWKWVTGSPMLLAGIPLVAWLWGLGHRKSSKQA